MRMKAYTVVTLALAVRIRSERFKGG